MTEGNAGGTDTVQSTVSFTLGNFVVDLELSLSSNIDGTGNSLDNTIIGNSGDNTITGGAGNDTINGGLGNDTFRSGAGRDIFVLSSGFGHDTINDFTNGFDQIDI
ncbi:MAG: hypothetical protein OSB76_01630 [Alphaproteobacteria bacterium]|nr:hypothetical protein [Alphaproteobacteria bacterium]